MLHILVVNLEIILLMIAILVILKKNLIHLSNLFFQKIKMIVVFPNKNGLIQGLPPNLKENSLFKITLLLI